MKYVTRSQWGAKAPRSRTRLSGSKGLTGHYNGPKIILPESCGKACYQAVRNTQNFHMNSRGWTDIAYNWLICPHGTIFEGRGWDVRSAANGTNQGNAWGHAVMVLIGEGQPFPDPAKRAFHEIRLAHRSRYATTGLTDHSDWKNTACSGSAVRGWIRSGAPVPGARPASPAPVSDSEEEFTMIYGTKSDDVKQLQHLLNRFIVNTGPGLNGGGAPHSTGSHLKVDGDFGAKTLEFASVALERAHKILAHPTYADPKRITPQTQAWLVVVLREVMRGF